MLRFIGRSELGPDQLNALDALLDEILLTAAAQHDGDRETLRTELAYLLFEEAVKGHVDTEKLKAVVLQRFSSERQACA